MPEKIVWKKVSEECFQALKHALLSKLCLFPADVSKCYHSFTDPSNICVAAWIGKNDDENKMHPIAFASRNLSKHQLNWPVIHEELYAVVWSTEHFCHLLYCTEIDLHSDHRPILWLRSLSVHGPIIARWALLLQSFSITPQYINGSENVVADGLSRLRQVMLIIGRYLLY
jgi:RNase H-like domain found in reverse transcriptase